MKNNKHTEHSTHKNTEEVMDLNYIRNLVQLLSESNVDEIEIEENGKKIRIAKAKNNFVSPSVFPQQFFTPPTSFPTTQDAKRETEPAPSVPLTASPKTKEIRSPIVGTFYRFPAPDADPYVQVGEMVHIGTVLCIIEAMKLMNEIESDVEGKIVKILVENGKPVEFNQPLFLVEPV